jgi:hypothetical protein
MDEVARYRRGMIRLAGMPDGPARRRLYHRLLGLPRRMRAGGHERLLLRNWPKADADAYVRAVRRRADRRKEPPPLP